MTGRDFLLLARRLVAGSTEAEWRTAVSRGYYGAFHGARDYLQDLGFRVPADQSAHKYLIHRLSNAIHPDALLIGTKLDRLRDQRNAADYDFGFALSQPRVAAAVSAGESIYDALDDLRREPARTDITDAIVRYERGRQQVTWRPPTP